MRFAESCRADMRAFRWHLAPLERKLEASIEAAQAAISILHRQAEAAREGVERLVEQRRHQLRSATEESRSKLDPHGHARCLRYLVGISGTIERKQAELSELCRRVDASRRDCSYLERQLASVVRMREAAQSAYAAGQFRVAEKEADAAWLAGRAREERTAAWLYGGAE